MSKIRFKHVSEDEVAVILDGSVPLEMVEALTKSLEVKGMYEDTVNSSVTYRTFLRKGHNAYDIADELIKSLQGLAKDDNPYSKETRRANTEKNKINDRRAQAKLPPLNEGQIAAANQPKPAAPIAPVKPVAPVSMTPSPFAGSTQSGPATSPGVPNRLHNGYSSVSPTSGAKKSEDDEDSEVEKSGYGPKKGGQYSTADNARRKANNTGDVAGVGPNVNTKSFSSKPGQLSSKQQVNITANIQARANKKMPVTNLGDMSPEKKKALNDQYNTPGMKKSEWASHNPFPSAEEEIMKFAKSNKPESGEEASANQLMNLMQNKNMLGEKIHPAIRDMFAAPPPQPTDQQMFGHLAVTEEMEKANNEKWQKGAFGWLAEASQPISQRFNSEEEEAAYWSRIKVGNTGSEEGY